MPSGRPGTARPPWSRQAGRRSSATVTGDWPGPALQHMPVLAERWHGRAAAFGTAAFVTAGAGKQASWIAAFPEAVALTTILTDLNLRRYIALGYDDRPAAGRTAEDRPAGRAVDRPARGDGDAAVPSL
jgi:hypothetical protein